jgi:hypothetical protein
MKKINSLHAVLCMLFVVACLSTSALGQSTEDKNPLTSMTSSGSSVRWEVAGPYSALVMTVSAPDGRVFRKEFQGGSSPEFTLIDNKGERLPDGQYIYELRVTPIFAPGVKEELARLRASEGAPEPAKDMSKHETTSEALVQKVDTSDAIREMRKRGRLPEEPVVKSGGFTILNGMAIVPGGTEGSERQPTKDEPRPAKRVTELSRLSSVPPGGRVAKVKQHHLALNALPDNVIPDDLIVQGSACVGLDCVNGEVFGFDTIRVKENNTRIQFDDTSASGFPLNNWQIRANSSAAGGASFLGFVDQGASGNSETGTIVFEVDAGAPANSLKVSSTGPVGLRTATPVLDIHINTGNTPAIRLEQNNSSGFTAQTWDVAGNEANFFVRDVTGGSRLPFRIRPGAPTSSLDISASGNVGVGLASPLHKLDVAGNATIGSGFNSAVTVPANGLLVEGGVGIATATPDQTLTVNGGASKPGGGSWSVFSDERLKNMKGSFNSGLSAVMQLQPLRYEYKTDNALGLKSPGEHIGFGAQALQRVIPEAVSRSSSGYLQVNNDPIIWTMLNAIKEQQKEIEQLKGEVQKLRARSQRRR